MKPKEILNEYGIKRWYSQAETFNTLKPYAEKDCVIVYNKGIIGFIFIIKSARKHLAFCGIRGDIYLGGHGYTFRKIYSLRKAIKLLGEDYKVLDKKELSKIRDKIILEVMEEENESD